MSISRRGERREAETCIQLLQGGGLSLQTAESPTRVTHSLFRPFASAAPRQLAPLICLVNTGRIKKKILVQAHSFLLGATESHFMLFSPAQSFNGLHVLATLGFYDQFVQNVGG